MNYREQNKRVARETMLITEQGFYLKEDNRVDLIGKNFDKAIVVLPDNATEFKNQLPQTSGNSFAEISVSNEDSFAAARKFGGDCLVMNFASAHSPGGGFLTGANAQEESLCRESTLYRSLTSEVANEMYAYNGRHRNPCKYNAMIISPSVCVFRDIKDELLDEPFSTAVITVPALNKNGKAKNIPQNVIDEVMVSRLRNLFAVAAHYGYKNLVLGAWGCGAFGHEPERVADYFCYLLFHEDFGYYFDAIVFAILDSGEKRNLKAFREVFGDVSATTNKFEMIKQQIKRLEESISTFELPVDAIFHRLADISLLDFFRAVWANGGFFQDDGFTDTSAHRIVAPSKDFIELKILVPRGIGRGAHFAPMSSFPKEEQFTLNRGTIYKMLDVNRSVDGIWQFTIIAIGRNPKEFD